MKTIEQLQQEQAKQLAKLEYELNVAAAMPVTPDRVMATTLGEPWVTYKVKGIRPVIELMQRFTVVSMSVLKDGCTSVKPLEQMKPEKRDNANGTYACTLTVNEGDRISVNAKFHFFARVEPIGLVRVIADIEGPDYIGGYRALGAVISEQRDRNRNNRITARSYSANPRLYGLFDHRINWATGDMGPIKTGANIEYFLCAEFEGDTPGAQQRHALDQLTNLCDQVEPLPQTDGESEQ
ncbi:MAG: hypothetical protein ACREA9_21065 [Pyrinomonadaceae bacterium]